MDSCKDCYESLSSIPILYAPPETSSSLMNTNMAPNAAEADQIQSLLAAASTTIDLLNTRLDHVQIHLKAYETAKKTCLEYVAAHRRVLSVVNRVPREIWGEIFQWRQMDHWHNEAENESDGTFGGGKLHIPQIQAYGIVSALWRHVTINTPCLWSTIEWSTFALPSNACDLLELWLLRSEHHPLSVTVSGGCLYEPALFQFVQGVKILLDHGCRWQNFQLDMDASNLMEHWPHALQNAPILETCYFSVGKWSTPIILNAPRMSNVQLDIYSQDGNTPPLVPWLNVLKLTLGQYSMRSFPYFRVRSQANCLKDCPSLEEYVVLNHTNDRLDQDYDVPSLTHSSLKSLSIHGGRPILLSGLTLPSITRLKLSCRDREVDRQSITDFILRSPNLRHLCLANEYGTIKNLNHPWAGTFDKLTLEGVYRDMPRMDKALCILQDFKILPELKTLVIHVELPSFEYLDRSTVQSVYARLIDNILDLCSIRLRGLDDRGRSLYSITVLVVKESRAAAIELDSLVRLETKARNIEGLNVQVDANLPLLLY